MLAEKGLDKRPAQPEPAPAPVLPVRMRAIALVLSAWIVATPDGLEDVSQRGVLDQVDGGHDAATDAGIAIWQRCEEFAPDAGDVAVELPSGAVMLSSARARYDACKLGAAGKCNELLLQVDAGVPAVDQTKSYTWLVTSIICATSGLASAYIQNRTARHLPILP